jgi:arylsulfatase
MITLHALIDAKTPLDLEHDGFNITPDLLGQKNSQRPMLYREFSGYGGQQAVWMGKWKGIRQKMIRKGKNHDPLKIELFDLSKDESESEDLATKHPDVVNKIKNIMEKEHTPSEYFPIKVID